MGRWIAPIVLALACAGCTSEKLQFDTLQLGRSLNPDKTVGSHTTTFKPSDTIHVSVLTSNTGAGTIAVRWSFDGRVVSEASKSVSYTGAGVTEFTLLNSGRFPAGSYKVDVLIDGQHVADREFRVEE